MPNVKVLNGGGTIRIASETTEQKSEPPYVNESTSESSGDERKAKYDRIRRNETAKTLWRIASWTPKRCRWDPENPPKFTLALNLLFGFVSSFSKAQSMRDHGEYEVIILGGISSTIFTFHIKNLAPLSLIPSSCRPQLSQSPIFTIIIQF